MFIATVCVSDEHKLSWRVSSFKPKIFQLTKVLNFKDSVAQPKTNACVERHEECPNNYSTVVTREDWKSYLWGGGHIYGHRKSKVKKKGGILLLESFIMHI